jgi:hypothetical protein
MSEAAVDTLAESVSSGGIPCSLGPMAYVDRFRAYGHVLAIASSS